MKIELYSLPNYYINKNITLTYTGISSLLANPIITTTDVAQVDLNNVVVGYNYYNFIKDNINYLRVDEKFCYFISNVSMRNNGNVLLTLELDSIHTTELLKECNIFDLVGASYVKRGLSSKSKKYNKVVKSFTFDNDLVVTSKDYLVTPTTISGQIYFYTHTFTSNIMYKCIYAIVNDNFLLSNTTDLYIKDITNNINYSRGARSLEYHPITKERGITTNKRLLILPFADSFNFLGQYRIYSYLSNDTDVSAGASDRHINNNLDSNNANLLAYLNDLVQTDATNVIDYGVAYFPLGDMDLVRFVLPASDNLNVYPVYYTNDIEPFIYTKLYSNIYKNEYTNVYIKNGSNLLELPNPQLVDNITFTLYYTISSDFNIRLKVDNLLTEKKFEIFNVSDTIKISLPVYIDGVERQTLLNSAMIKNQLEQLEKSYSLTKSLEPLEVASSSLNILGNTISKPENMGNIGGLINNFVNIYKGFNMRDINYEAQKESLYIRKNNIKYATSSYTSGKEANIDIDYLDAPFIYYVNYNNDYNKMLYCANGVEVNRVVPSATLSTLNNTFIACTLNFNISLNYNIASDIINLFDSGVYIFNNDAEALNFINTGLGLTDFDL